MYKPIIITLKLKKIIMNASDNNVSHLQAMESQKAQASDDYTIIVISCSFTVSPGPTIIETC